MRFREVKFQNFPGERGLGPSGVLASLALDHI